MMVLLLRVVVDQSNDTILALGQRRHEPRLNLIAPLGGMGPRCANCLIKA